MDGAGECRGYPFVQHQSNAEQVLIDQTLL